MANAISSYAFASPNVSLRNDEFNHVLSFLGVKKLGSLERVCQSWKRFIRETDLLWKKQCQYLFNIDEKVDPRVYLPECSSYKDGIKKVFSRILNEDTYRYYLGAEIGPVPRIPEDISLKRFNEPDPCEKNETIGDNYFWMYCPPEIEMAFPKEARLYLDKPDDSNDEEAPRLKRSKVELEITSEKITLKVPNTINNLGKIFKYPKHGKPSGYDFIWDRIVKQHGHKRTQGQWICMRKEMMWDGLSFSEQQKNAENAGVDIPPLIHRIIFNFLIHVISGSFPDAHRPFATFSRTSTIVPGYQ